MPRAGLDRTVVVDAAVEAVDELGAEALTLALLAARLGVKAPSLYKHVGGLGDLRAAVAVESKRELAAALERAAVGHGGEDAVVAIAGAYRAWAKVHPGRYPMTIVAERSDDPEDVEASTRLYAVVAAALRSLRLEGAGEVDAIRALRAALHGFVGLETAGGFGLPDDVDRSYALMVTDLVAALEARAQNDETPAG
ncbi:TetR-like C-terminal domain-containing protein [Demequina sp. NBRC 110054]|uniref:TetR-like C-terminal domain-containing protein n=1 Tax=Demequina sp. NBRC 110054 TaxID=1570343 RepID=UPI000A02F3AA|nr:TetR-like C-terminal domain-containing protein [Demequina sp. NBRC 110054]